MLYVRAQAHVSAYKKVVVSCSGHGGGVPSRGRGLRYLAGARELVGGNARGRRWERESGLLSGAGGRVETSARSREGGVTGLYVCMCVCLVVTGQTGSTITSLVWGERCCQGSAAGLTC